MSSAFSRKLAGSAKLTDREIALLDEAVSPARLVPANHDLISEGDKPGSTFIVLDGWACRYKMLPDGSRQIMAFLLPGDFCDLHVGLLDEMDHNIGTIAPCQVASLPGERMGRLVGATPMLTQAFWRSQLVDEGVMRAWIVSMGRRDSTQRVAHLMLELYLRMRTVGLATDKTCRMPLTQMVLADALGLTPVHLNRVLRILRERNVMTFTLGTLNIHDVEALVRIAGFDDNYLHRRTPGKT